MTEIGQPTVIVRNEHKILHDRDVYAYAVRFREEDVSVVLQGTFTTCHSPGFYWLGVHEIKGQVLLEGFHVDNVGQLGGIPGKNGILLGPETARDGGFPVGFRMRQNADFGFRLRSLTPQAFVRLAWLAPWRNEAGHE